MLIFIAFLYFCCACSLIWLAFFPKGRHFVALMRGMVYAQLSRSQSRWQQLRRHQFGRAARLMRQLARLAQRHRYLLAATGAGFSVPSIIVFCMSRPGQLPHYEASQFVPDSHIAALLEGEQLVAPVALPPLAFSTREVELVRPMLANASRNWDLLDPDLRQRLLLAFKIMKERHGYEMALLEGYRSPARQTLLAAMGSQVSNASAFQSYHQYGLAADCAFWRDGKLIISEKDPWAMRGYQLYGAVAETLGLTWGGRWTMMDFGHAELRRPGVIKK